MFISDDKKHDVPCVEKCNEILHHHYVKEGLQINHDIEYSDGCSSQFKCIRVVSSLARRPVKTMPSSVRQAMKNQIQMALVVWSRLLHHVLYVVSNVSLEMQGSRQISLTKP